MTRLAYLLACLMLLPAALARAESTAAPIRVASPEAVFLDVARQIGGSQVVAELVRASDPPPQRPQILIYEGGAYDRWIAGALVRMRAGAVIAARALAPGSRADEPSWYDLSAMSALGEALAQEFARQAPAQASAIGARLDGFRAALAALKSKSKAIVDGYGGTSILLTDGRFQPFCQSLGLSAVTLAAAGATARSAIVSRKGVVLIYNSEAVKGLGALKTLAEDNGVPLVGLRVTLPSGLNYQQWIGRQINAVHGALNEAAP